MKKLLIIVPLMALVANATDITLAWNPSPTVGVTNNVLYANTNIVTSSNRTNALVRLDVGTNSTAVVQNLTNRIWYFATAAMKNGIESEVSGNTTIEVPAPPSNMRTIVVQYSGTITNFYDVGFFRLKLGN